MRADPRLRDPLYRAIRRKVRGAGDRFLTLVEVDALIEAVRAKVRAGASYLAHSEAEFEACQARIAALQAERFDLFDAPARATVQARINAELARLTSMSADLTRCFEVYRILRAYREI